MSFFNAIVYPFAQRDRIPLYASLIFLVSWVILAISPIDRSDWFVENILVIMAFLLLVFTYRYYRFSNLSYICMTILLVLHAIGAHYTYGEVPINFSVPGILNPSRNNFDRIVHFAWGLLIYYPVYEIFLRIGRISIKWAYGLALAIIIAASSVFELIEMWGAKMMAKDLAAKYLGIQGDIWDAQEDMAMALYGAIITMSLLSFLRWYNERRIVKLSATPHPQRLR